MKHHSINGFVINVIYFLFGHSISRKPKIALGPLTCESAAVKLLLDFISVVQFNQTVCRPTNET